MTKSPSSTPAYAASYSSSLCGMGSLVCAWNLPLAYTLTPSCLPSSFPEASQCCVPGILYYAARVNSLNLSLLLLGQSIALGFSLNPESHLAWCFAVHPPSLDMTPLLDEPVHSHFLFISKRLPLFLPHWRPPQPSPLCLHCL